MTRRDIESRIQDLYDGKLAPEERGALLAEIGNDPELLETYMEHAVLECAFARLSRSGAFLAASPETTLHSRRKSYIRWSLAAAAVLALAAVPLHLIFFRIPPPTVTLRLSPDSVINVSHAMAKSEAPPGTLMPGSRARLDQGTVELIFASGVRAIVMGPADLTLHDGGNLFMQTGTGWFHVPPNATGFKVQTPAMTLTDLGTVFGVISRKDGPPQAHVLKGKVNVRTHGQASMTETLGAGMARAVESSGHLKEIPTAPERFLKTLPDSLPHLHWSFDRAAALADAQGSLPGADCGSGHMDGLDNRAAFGATAGKFGSALASTATFSQARCSWPGIEGSAPRTIAFWIKLDAGGQGSVVAQPIIGWGSHTLTPFNPNPAFLTYLRQVGGRSVAGVSFGAYFVDGTTPLDDGRWHHFAVVCSGQLLLDGKPELACYVDGRPEAMTANVATALLTPGDPNALAVRTDSAAPEAIPATLFPVNWCHDQRTVNVPLALDELYIFEAALSEEQVKTLYQKNHI